MNKEEIQRMKLSDLYFKHLDATWEEIEIVRQERSDKEKIDAGKWSFSNKRQYLQAYK